MEGFGLEAEARMTTWHVMMPTENEADATHSHDVSEGEKLLHIGLCWHRLLSCACNLEATAQNKLVTVLRL